MAESLAACQASSRVANLQAEILGGLDAGGQPMTAAAVREKLRGRIKIALPELEKKLCELTSQGDVYRFPPYRSKSARYWTQPLGVYAENLLVTETINRFETKRVWARYYKARLEGVGEQELCDLIERLVVDGKMHCGKFLGSTSFRYSASPLDARAVMINAIDQIAKRFSLSVADVRSLVNPAVNITAAVTDQAASATPQVIAFPVASAPDAVGGQSTVVNRAEEARLLVLEALNELRPGGGGSILSLVELRRFLEFKLSGEEFNVALRDLEQTGVVDLTLHPDPASLSDSDKGSYMLGALGPVYDMVIVRR
jgi:hypothetical protein